MLKATKVFDKFEHKKEQVTQLLSLVIGYFYNVVTQLLFVRSKYN